MKRVYQAFRFDHWTWPLALLIPVLWGAVLGCASTQQAGSAPDPASLTPTQRIYQQYGTRLATSTAIYREVMIAAGEAHGRGLIDDAQLEQVRAVGHQARSALLLAQSALEVYVGLTPADPQAQDAGRTLSARLLEFDRLLLQLQDLARQGGIL